jgi:hypothetical protein
MKSFSQFVRTLLFVLALTIGVAGCTAGTLTGPVEEAPTTNTAPVEAPETNGDGHSTDPGGNDHNLSDT